MILARIAANRPDLHPTLARNPSTYPELLEWLEYSPDPAVHRALHDRDAGATAPTGSGGPPLTPPVSDPSAQEWEGGGAATPSDHKTALVGPVILGVLIAVIIGGGIIASIGHRDQLDALASESSAAASSATPSESPSEAEIFTPPPTPTISASTPLGSTTWTLTSPSGHTEKLTVSVSEPVTGTQLDGVAIGGGLFESPTYLSDVCSIDTARDAVVPVHIEATNTTSGVGTALSYALTAVPYSTGYYVAPTTLNSIARFAVAATYADHQNACDSLVDSGANGYWNATYAQGESGSKDVYIVIHDYVTPSTPQGDSQVLHLVRLIPFASTSDSDTNGEFYQPDEANVPLGLDGTVGDI